MMQQTITTDRLYLSIVTPDDHAFVRALVNSKGWLEFIGDRNVHSDEDAIAYVNRILATPDIYYWVVKADGVATGIVSFIKRDYLDHFDIGFAFLPNHSGNGYAYEAAKAVLDMVSEDPLHHTVLATTMPENLPSIKLLSKLGLHFDKEIENGGKPLLLYKREVQ